MSTTPTIQLSETQLTGTYQGRYTDVTGKAENLDLDLTFENGMIRGRYQARATGETPYVVTGEVMGNYQGDQFSLTVELDQGTTLPLSGYLRKACEYADTALIGMVDNIPGAFGEGVFIAWNGLFEWGISPEGSCNH